ncbi:creatininase family protein [Gordonia amicalis]|uniref:creatininase family protein n=1 Tax=Gordonia TaxID=2053 RepID=UPI0002A64830|nr:MULTISPECIES: creatininase family protein [Gordonia]MBA5848449.1 creatininase family protein [Gordonia amicalis]MDV7101192.1 creatininase family protein [Gordonia amicalis]MDV7175792.1 creatininase family protein [Gordonia amicalis]UKO92092.1 creatininase family protein [Gordonia amicalis]UOG23357.1 creatininase family protein [Gordonia amicalis]
MTAAFGSRRYAELTTAEIDSALSRDSILVLPTGAIEPHGPHLPLATDLIVAEAVSAAVVGRGAAAGHDVWLLPALGYTKSDEHAALPGTMWLRPSTLFETIVDIGSSMAATPARRLLFLNAHGGNSALIEVAARELRRRFGLQTFFTSGPGRAGPTERGLGIHAGWAETSMMLHLRPDLVQMDKAVAAVADAVADSNHVGFTKAVKFGWLSTDFAESGVIGDPTGADAAIGAELFEERVIALVDALADIATFDPGRVRR